MADETVDGVRRRAVLTAMMGASLAASLASPGCATPQSPGTPFDEG